MLCDIILMVFILYSKNNAQHSRESESKSLQGMNVVQLHSIANEIQKTKQKKRTGENQKKKGKTLGRRRKLSLYLSDFVLLRWHVCNYYLAASSLCVCLVKMCWLFLKTNTHAILVVYLTQTHV